MPAILGGVLVCVVVLTIVAVVLICQWHQRAKAKQDAVKMTMVLTGLEDNEPLRPTNVKPNLAKLRIVKEAEMRKGGILGYGAFGTVFKVSGWVVCNEK
jgi:L1 cell adhesion molecule